MNIAALASGGVDSSVSIHLLCEQGLKPDLFYIKIGMEGFDKDFSCSQEEDLEVVSWIAKQYGLHLEVVDLQQEYWNNVVAYTLDKVRKGLTPNPDVMCNRLIKFGAFNEKVGVHYDKIMTGHYATIVGKDNLLWLGTGVDLVKDQTDFLAQIDSWQLNKAIFPIGDLPKSEVRRIAAEHRLVSATRKDSQGICFLGKINYNDFIEKYLGTKEGNLVEYETNKVMGKHKGFWFHTIGQRKGIGLSGGPWYVCKKDMENNIVYITRNPNIEDLFRDEYANRIVTINLGKHIHWITKNPFGEADASFDITFKIRHQPYFLHGSICHKNDNWFIVPRDEVIGIAPGQFCVIYDNESKICFGSGEITL